VEHKHAEEHEEHSDGEPAVVRMLRSNELMAEEMQAHGIQCEAVPLGSHPLEGKPVYSHLFPLSPKITTNKGLVKVVGRNFDYVQVIQRS
jgi:hypothetical protein